MKYESVQQAREALKKLEQTQAAYNHALGVLYLDATTAAPSDTWEGRGKTMEVMSQITYDLLVNDENNELLSYLEATPMSWMPRQSGRWRFCAKATTRFTVSRRRNMSPIPC